MAVWSVWNCRGDKPSRSGHGDETGARTQRLNSRPAHHTSFSPNCNCRPTVCELPSLPKPGLPTVRDALVGLGRLNVGVFVRLKASARNSTRLFSPILKFL